MRLLGDLGWAELYDVQVFERPKKERAFRDYEAMTFIFKPFTCF